MRINKLSSEICIASLVLAAALAGCNDNDDVPTVDQNVADAMATGTAVGNDLVAASQTELATSGSVLVAVGKVGSMIHTMNDTAIAQANAAAALTFNTSAREYAVKEVNDHTANNQVLDALLASMQIVPIDNSVSQRLRDQSAAQISQLNSTAGPDVARIYLQLEVQDHQQDVVLIGSFSTVSTGTSFDPYVSDTENMFAAHRDEAETRLRALGRL